MQHEILVSKLEQDNINVSLMQRSNKIQLALVLIKKLCDF